jgi:2-polyprenyl-3-methyl-5-hydroxy-6-metoxy-1,4-benzoquinol methylase
MTSARRVSAEMLDGLSADDPAALRSRRDLQRLHRAMRTRTILLRALRELLPERTRTQPLRILELGAGDGSLLLGVARELASAWPQVELTLLDRQSLVSAATRASYEQLGWRVVPLVVDVLDWAAAADETPRRWDVVVANLFLHHFEGVELSQILAAAAARCERFLACEPRRSRIALVASHLVVALGANAVTRVDAVLSVHAGFRGGELSALWPGPADAWRLQEFAAGPFSHVFSAVRASAA